MDPHIDHVLTISPLQQQSEKEGTEILFLDSSNFVVQELVSGYTTSSPFQLQILSINPVSQNDKNVYVCSLCQKFSERENVILDHIENCHSESLLIGIPAKKFVKRLQSLQCENKILTPKKRGRPKKCDTQRPEAIKHVPQPEPTAGPDGYFWCQKCYKYFKKSRQLLRHICLDTDDPKNDQYDLHEDEDLDTDTSKDFKIHMNIECLQHSTANKCRKRSYSILDEVDTNHLKEAKTRVPIFSNEEEKIAFEKHLKAIDFSCVEHLILKEGRKCPKKRKKSCKHDEIYSYSCQVCKKVFKSLSHIQMHCLIHTSLKPFTCPKCSYATNSKGNLYIHIRKHTGNVFRCSYCEFQSGNRSHILEHEETHLSNSQSCNLCQKIYKTTKSLINHVRMYHNNARGLKYLTLLTLNFKQGIISSTNNLEKEVNLVSDSNNDFVHVDHQPMLTNARNEQVFEFDVPSQAVQNEIICDSVFGEYPSNSSSIPLKESNNETELGNQITIEKSNISSESNYLDPPVLQCAFQQTEPNAVNNTSLTNYNQPSLSKEDHSFSESNYQNSIPESGSLQFTDNVMYKQLQFAKTSVIENCLQEANFTDASLLNRCEEEVSNLIDKSILDQCNQLCQVDEVFTNSSLLEKGGQLSELSQALLPDELSGKSELDQQAQPEKYREEAESAETKLFKKCHRLQAYVCCVCTTIFIDPDKLKNHLKGHATDDSNYNNVVAEPQQQEFQSKKQEEASSSLDNVCKDLTDTLTEEQLFDKHLEKLYSSSLDMSYYLPELSVTLANLFDSVLEDSSNFPINEKYDGNDELSSKAAEENMLKYFEEM